MDVKASVQSYKEELLARLATLVAINSEEGKAEDDAPFGKGPKEALQVALGMMEKDGYVVKNLDNYIGYAEMGEGDQVIGVIGHLDIVPARLEDGWASDPFTLSMDENEVLYGRGVSDDKGAMVASMIAMNIVRDMNVPMNKRVRLILGCNEETGSKCLAHYVKEEGHVDYGFTPDGDFPCVHGEKGMVRLHFKSKNTKILNIEGGRASNVVCAKCRVEVLKQSYCSKKLNDYFNNHNMKFEIESLEDRDVITVYGQAAHASTPELGVNAICYLMEGLKLAGYQDDFVKFFTEHFGVNYDGDLLGCKVSDEYGMLTMVPSTIHMEDGVISGNVDIRYPVTLCSKKIVKMMEDRLEDDFGLIEVGFTVEPLFFAKDSKLVSSLLEAYQETTGDYESQPITLGGGTYAKGIDNTIAFGCAFPNMNYHIHDVNEFVPLDHLMKQVEIYVAAILKLLAL